MQEFLDRLREMISSEICDLVHTIAPGKIMKVADNKTASVKPGLKIKTDDGREVPYPQISGIHILMPIGNDGRTGLAYPVKVKDDGILLFNEGGTGSDEKFSLSNAYYLAGLCESEQSKKAGDEDSAVLFSEDTEIAVSKSSIKISRGNGTTIDITDGKMSINVTDVVVMGNLTVTGSLIADGINMNTHTHVGVHGGTSGPV